MAKIPDTGKVTIADIAAEWEGPKDLAELSKKPPLNMSGTEQVGIDDFRGKFYGSSIEATGGTITNDGVWQYHTFTSNGTFEVTQLGERAPYLDIDVLIVAGGATGASNGGGGAGGMIEASYTAVLGSKQVEVGAGGVATHGNFMGKRSLVTGFTEAYGGGHVNEGATKGSGAGGISNNTVVSGQSGTSGQGNKGGNSGTTFGVSGGGGGRAQAGGNAPGSNAGGKGGNGKAWLNGVTYCGGGGGGSNNDSGTAPENQRLPRPIGGSGGGGHGKYGTRNSDNSINEINGTSATNYGSGGGSGGGTSIVGYQGIVIFRYRIAPDGSTRKAIDNLGYAPAIEPAPDHNPATHKAVPNMIEDPMQETVGWTIVELTAEEKAAYAEAIAAQGEEE